jgi:hypothetical protein
VECQGADFAGAQSDIPFTIRIEGEINVNAIRYPTSIIIFAIAFSIFLMLMA